MSIFDFRIQKILDDGDDAGVPFQLADGGTVGMELACIEHHGIGRPHTDGFPFAVRGFRLEVHSRKDTVYRSRRQAASALPSSVGLRICRLVGASSATSTVSRKEYPASRR